jgi:hypothetical protein
MSSAMKEGALVTYALDEIVETLSALSTFTDKAYSYDPSPESLQRSGDSWFKPIEQQVRDVDGWDVSSDFGGVIELSIGGSLDVPSNVPFQLRADDLRDERSYRRRISAAAVRLRGQVEERGIQKAVTHGAFAVTNSAVVGATTFTAWDALAQSESKMFDLEYAKDMGTCSFMNSVDYLAGGRDLTQSTANYQSKLPDEAYNKGLIQKQVGGVNEVYRHNKLPNITGQSVAITVTGNQTFAPIATIAAANGSNVPFDNRFADLTVSATAAVTIGDKFEIAGMFAVSRDGKIQSTHLMSFTVVAKPDGTTLTISPRPYAWDERPIADGGTGVLTRDESAYANVSTAFNGADVPVWLNTTTGRANVIMTQDSMVLASSPIPTSHDMFSNLKTESFSVAGISGIIGWQGTLGTLQGQVRMAVWYDWQVEKPEECGIFMGGQV